MASRGSLPPHASLGGGKEMWEGIFSVMPSLQSVGHGPFSYHFSGTSSTYFGDRVAFVLCSIWMDASSSDQQLLCGYSSCREGKVFVMSFLLPDHSPHTLFTPTSYSCLCRRVLIYSEIFVLNFNLWSGSYYIIIN